MSRSFSAELRFIYSQQNLQAIVGISKELAKLGAVEKMRGGCAEDSIFHFPRDGRTSSEEVGPGELLRFLGLTFFFFFVHVFGPVPAVPVSQDVLWGCHCFPLAAQAVISGCSHRIFNMFPVSGFQLRRLVALIECYWTTLILENYCVK